MITVFFFFNDTATTEIYTLSLHDALPICRGESRRAAGASDLPRGGAEGDSDRLRDRARIRGRSRAGRGRDRHERRSEEHTSELQSQSNLVCRLLLEKKQTEIGLVSYRTAW